MVREPDLTAERPLPRTFVDEDDYLAALDDAVDRRGFPDPDPAFVPAVTKARFVARAAREAGAESFAEAVAVRRGSLLEPLDRFEVVAALAGEAEVDPAEVRDAVGDRAVLDDGAVDSLVAAVESARADGREATAVLDDRARTFAHYPGPPGHVLEAALDRGRERASPGDGASVDAEDRAAAAAEDRAAAAADDRTAAVDHDRYAGHRATVAAVAAGGRAVGAESYDQMRRHHDEVDREWPYEDAGAYGAVVGFNAALAAESMLELDGEIVTPP